MIIDGCQVFIFRESATWKGKPTRGRRTFVCMVGKVRVDIGIAQCHSNDQFLRKRGTEIATGRAYQRHNLEIAADEMQQSYSNQSFRPQIREGQKLVEIEKVIRELLVDCFGFRWTPRPPRKKPDPKWDLPVAAPPTPLAEREVSDNDIPF